MSFVLGLAEWDEHDMPVHLRPKINVVRCGIRYAIIGAFILLWSFLTVVMIGKSLDADDLMQQVVLDRRSNLLDTEQGGQPCVITIDLPPLERAYLLGYIRSMARSRTNEMLRNEANREIRNLGYFARFRAALFGSSRSERHRVLSETNKWVSADGIPAFEAMLIRCEESSNV